MDKITILSKKKKNFHSIMAFYDFKGKAINECDCGKFIFRKSYNFETREYNSHTTQFDREELKNLKKALLEAS